jgi:hypothetical protein
MTADNGYCRPLHRCQNGTPQADRCPRTAGKVSAILP